MLQNENKKTIKSDEVRRALEKQIKKSYDVFREKRLKERSKTVIASLMQITNNRADFEKELEKQRISVLFRINEEGRIYGATFVDHEKKAIFNGSRLGKEFSANAFHNFFNCIENTSDNTFKPFEKKPFVPFEKSQNEFMENTGFGGIFDLFTSDISGSDEMEEQNLTRQMKKKKKRQRRL